MRRKMFTIRSMMLALMAVFVGNATLQAKDVSEELAARIAGRLMPVGEKQLVKRRATKANMTDMEKVPYYIFTGKEGRGFVIVAADDIARPILGYSADAVLTTDGELPIPMEQWLTSISNEIRKAQANGAEQTEEVARQWRRAGVGNTVVQLETAQWGQNAPFYNQCPSDQGKRSLSGCVPTAYAILMKYYNYPQAGKGKTSRYVTKTKSLTVGARSLEHEYDWDNMPLKFTTGQYNATQASNVATLLADIGAAIQVDYTNYNTDGFLGKGALFTNFDFYPGTAKLKDAYTADEWTDILRKELNMERPIIYRADNLEENGHAFIIDGYTDEGYFSVNWGWYGSYNGLFTLDALTPGVEHYKSGQVAYLNTVPMPMSNAPFEVEMNGVYYPTLTVAIDEVPHDKTPTTIYLRADMQAETYRIKSDQDICLELGSHSIDLQFSCENSGKLTVRGTDESLMSSRGNSAVISNYGTLDIEGGTYKNISPIIGNQDYRRSVWTAEGTTTRISNVVCESPSQVVCTNGMMTIESGTFTCKGNSAVINNYCTKDILTINGGTYINNCTQVSGSEYRRCLWTTQNSNTIIGKASFINHYGNQTLCFNGNATIDGAEIVNKNDRYGCLAYSDARVVINSCRMRAARPLYADTNAKITCLGGIYSAKVEQQFLGEGCECVANTEAETKAVYPYMVYNKLTGISDLLTDEYQQGMKSYNANGTLLPSMQKGVNIIRYSDGTTRKVLLK